MKLSRYAQLLMWALLVDTALYGCWIAIVWAIAHRSHGHV